MANKIGVAIQVDDGGAVKKINGVSKAFDKLGGKGSGASLFGNVGAAAVVRGFGMIDSAIGSTIGFLADSVRAFNDDAQSQALLEQALQNNVTGWKFSQQAVNDYVDAQINRGFIDDDVRASLSQLIGITHDTTKAQELNTLAEDLARAKGIDLATATDIVTKAAQGNTKALKPLGIEVGKTTDAAVILDAIQKNVAGSADTWASTTSGKLQIAQDKFAEAQEKLGGVIMPILADVMSTMVNDWIPALGRGFDKVRPIILNVAGAIGAVIGVIQRVIGWIGDMIGAIGRGIDKINKFIAKIGDILSIHSSGGSDPIGDFIFGNKSPTTISGGARMPSGTGGGLAIQGVSEKQILDMVDRGLYFRLQRAAPTLGRS